MKVKKPNPNKRVLPAWFPLTESQWTCILDCSNVYFDAVPEDADRLAENNFQTGISEEEWIRVYLSLVEQIKENRKYGDPAYRTYTTKNIRDILRVLDPIRKEFTGGTRAPKRETTNSKKNKTAKKAKRSG